MRSTQERITQNRGRDAGQKLMTYEEALEYIHGTYKFGKKLGLHNIRMLLELMGDPQKKLRFVHIAGTNGKGSTSAFIAAYCRRPDTGQVFIHRLISSVLQSVYG
jgi:folylpolyglutamate synthase/dihydropteroate synthase